LSPHRGSGTSLAKTSPNEGYAPDRNCFSGNLLKTNIKAEHPGSQIRALRKLKGWNLKDLSERSGIAHSTLSKVENEQLSLTYDRMLQLAEAFGMSLPEFLSEVSPDQSAPPAARICWGDITKAQTHETALYLYNYLCTELRAKAMVPIISEVKIRSIDEVDDYIRHAGEEFVYVLSGTIEVHTEFYEPRRLGPNEFVYLDSRMGHVYVAVSRKTPMILSVNLSDRPSGLAS